MSSTQFIQLLPVVWSVAWLSGLVVCTSAAMLFWITYKRERKLQAAWRAGGFLGLALSFALGLLSIWLPQAAFGALILQPFAFFVIYRGVYYEPILTHLRTASTRTRQTRTAARKKVTASRQQERFHLILVLGIATILFAISVTNNQLLALVSYGLSTLFILLTIHLQTRRLLWEQDSPSIRLQNFYPLVGYICLVFFTALSTPTNLLSTYVYVPPLALIGSMIFLALWAWIFIHVRNILRRSIITLVTLAIGSSLAILGLTYLATHIVQLLVART